jgi:Protein of unknown function (DUF1569)
MAKKTLSNPNHRDEILGRLNSVASSSERRWGRMTAHQMICHVADSFRAVLGDKKISPAQGMAPRRVMKWLALELPIRWPKGVRTRPEVDQLLGGTVPRAFETDREELRSILNRFTRQPRDFQFHPHPMFGDMSDDEWMRWGYLHTDHHLRQFGA